MTRRAGYDMFAGDYASTIRSCREALPVVERLGLDALKSRLMNLLGTSRVFTGDAAGTDEIEQGIEIARSVSSATCSGRAARTSSRRRCTSVACKRHRRHAWT